MDCATPLKVVRATIQPTPNSSNSRTAAHCGGAKDSAAMTMAATAAAASTRPSVFSRRRSIGNITAPRIAPTPTAPSKMP
ncbi:hypothetical protein G6F57_021743 [Rhizopus arrhizus]|nr:hypothetical protein G6F35_018275 [Rhizopus arrhizus]KAG1434106.1 hypothetical protein G6F57_021743 [Rhizopus arrhizus]